MFVKYIIEKAKQLAELPDGDAAKKIYIQRDLPPSIREANYKLRSQLKVEKLKPENQGVELKMNYKKGTLSRVIGEEEVIIFTVQNPF